MTLRRTPATIASRRLRAQAANETPIPISKDSP
jgi:hypothetical protein